MLSWRLHRDTGQAYISLTGAPPGGEVTSVDLGDLADDHGVDALRALVLDFGPDGRLLGIEVVGDAGRVLPRDLLAEQGHEQRRGVDGP